MEKMKPSLFDVPPEIVESIFMQLDLIDRQNLRLTCKWFYELCNSDRFCREEDVLWSEDWINHVNVKSDLFRIGRSYYNLVIANEELEKSSIVPIFEKIGNKVRSLSFVSCDLLPGSLESIITLCEGLCSLTVSISPVKKSDDLSDYFTIEPFSITRPNVTDLLLSLPLEEPYNYFHRMFSIFPNVQQLRIKMCKYYRISQPNLDLEELAEECSSIFDDMVTLGRNLVNLELNIPLSQSSFKNNFFEAFPNLRNLTVHFNSKNFSEKEKWYPCCSNLRSVKLYLLQVFGPPEMIRLLTNTGLECLIVQSHRLDFNKESFEKLVASQLNKIGFQVDEIISDPSVTLLDSRLEANETVTDLYLFTKEPSDPIEALFPKYFRRLVHLTIHSVTDSILQSIFQYQENLLSLKLGECFACTLNGFCGSKDGGSNYSINNLQKLEHLTIICIQSEIVKSDDFKRAFTLSRLKYLRIDSTGRRGRWQEYAEIPTELYENLTELRALRLKDMAIPYHETISSLFSRLKHLNYLRYDLNHPEDTATHSVTFINVNHRYFSVRDEEYQAAFSYGQAFYQKESNRMVILNRGLRRIFYSPKISTFEIDWIKA